MHREHPEQTITILDESTVNKIAAGELIERPASVVKELVENALDAGAGEIKIELRDGGKRLIRVTDNGIGMSRQDAVLALARHATSKIRSADDLFAVMTLGFRGEALPSICAVSHMEIVTRRDADECGTKVVAAGGQVLEASDAGAPAGTSVTIVELFENLPARRKFLKTAQTELSHVSESVNRFAVSHCGVDLTVVHNDRTIFRWPGSNRLSDAVLTVLGRDAAEAAIPILGESGPYNIYGLVSQPGYSKANRSGQFFFVNGRYVRSRNLTHALDEAYRGILPQGRFPLLIAFINVDPHLVDVNVHPTKIEVKFTREWEVHNLLATTIRDALSSSAVAPDGLDVLSVASPPREPPGFRRSPELQPRISPMPGMELEPFRRALAARVDREREAQPGEERAPELDSGGATDAGVDDPLADAAVLVQARNLYIVAQSPQGLLLVDQHVAHERILYDQLSLMDGSIHVQRLMMPFSLVLGHRESLVLENKLEDMRLLGFDIEPFGKDTFLVRSVPALIAEKNYEQILRDTVEELTELTASRRLVVQREGILATTACKMAVKSGERLSYEEMARLLSDLRQTSNPYLCPHGRPIVVCLTNRELDKLFGR